MANQRYIPGVDQPLPEGEELLWSGAPSIGAQLRHNPLLFAAAAWLVLAGALPMVLGIGGPGPTAAHLAWVGVVGAITVGLALGFAWLVARTTTYAITNQRVVMKIGIALPAVFNVPLDTLAGAGMTVRGDGSGDINLPLSVDDRVGYALLWPHARPWRFGRPEPMLRWVPDVAEPAAALQEAALGSGAFQTGSAAFTVTGKASAGRRAAHTPDRAGRTTVVGA